MPLAHMQHRCRGTHCETEAQVSPRLTHDLGPEGELRMDRVGSAAPTGAESGCDRVGEVVEPDDVLRSRSSTRATHPADDAGGADRVEEAHGVILPRAHRNRQGPERTRNSLALAADEHVGDEEGQLQALLSV